MNSKPGHCSVNARLLLAYGGQANRLIVATNETVKQQPAHFDYLRILVTLWMDNTAKTTSKTDEGDEFLRLRSIFRLAELSWKSSCDQFHDF